MSRLSQLTRLSGMLSRMHLQRTRPQFLSTGLSAPGSDALLTIFKAEQYWAEKFDQANIPEPEASVRHILVKILNLKSVCQLALMKNHILNEQEKAMLLEKARLRLQRVPIQYIVGEWDFLELTLKMSNLSSPVFIPRPETEELVLLVSSFIESQVDGVRSCLEIGSGSGAISLALLHHHKELFATGIDADPAAVSLARLNARALKLNDRAQFETAALTESGIRGAGTALQLPYDILVSNPPYIPTREIKELAAEIVEYEPHLALDGGPEGTDVLEMIVQHAPKWLNRGAFIFLELDARQIHLVERWTRNMGCYSNFCARDDCFGRPRFVFFQYS